jgi:peptidoglycan/LPS O-acetylase OafA/YrhL
VERDNFLDCVRALAATLVVFTHYRVWLPGGSIGVSVFFALSGFLICRILLRIELTPPNIAKFIFRRFMRVWPMMAVQLALTLVLMALLAPQNLPKLLPDIPGLLTFTSGYHIWVGVSPAVLWTLRAEFWFYIVFPLAMLCCGKSRLVRMILTGIAVSWLCKFMVGHNGEGFYPVKLGPAHFTLIYLDQLMYGAVAAILIERGDIRLAGLRHRAFLWLPLCAIALLATPRFTGYDVNWYLQTSAASLLTVILILHHSQGDETGDFEPLATIGRISYSIYLLHAVVIDYFPRITSDPLVEAMALIATILTTSLLTYRWIELPAIRFSKRIAKFNHLTRRQPICPNAETAPEPKTAEAAK